MIGRHREQAPAGARLDRVRRRRPASGHNLAPYEPDPPGAKARPRAHRPRLCPRAQPHDGRPPCDFEDRDDVDRLISELVEDAYELVWAAEDLGLQLDDQQQDAVSLLALVAGQDVEPGERPASGASPNAQPPIASSLSSIRSLATLTRPSTPTGTASRPTSPPSPRRASSPPRRSRPATPATRESPRPCRRRAGRHGGPRRLGLRLGEFPPAPCRETT